MTVCMTVCEPAARLIEGCQYGAVQRLCPEDEVIPNQRVMVVSLTETADSNIPHAIPVPTICAMSSLRGMSDIYIPMPANMDSGLVCFR